jgi:hypothetical protein
VKECGEVFQGHKHKAATSASRSKQSLARQGRTFTAAVNERAPRAEVNCDSSHAVFGLLCDQRG